MRLRLLALVSGLIYCLSPLSNATAAPQILAALPDAYGMPFTCEGGACATSISTLCLQKDKQIPLRGQPYYAAEPDQFTVRLTFADGTKRDVPAGELVTFASERDFVSVRVTMDRTAMKMLGAVSARLIVAENASLIPETDPRDPNPLSEREIAYVTTSVRQQAANLLHGRSDTQSAQAFGRLITAMREAGDLKGDAGRHELERLWDATLKAVPGGKVDTEAEASYRFCQSGPDRFSMTGIQLCLGYEHSRMLRELNVEHWNAKPGS